MKRFIFLLAFFPMFVSAQENRIGGRIAYTHTNKSYNFGFGGISFNTDPDYFAGVTTYAGAHFGAHHSKLKVVPRSRHGSVLPTGRSRNFPQYRVHTAPYRYFCL